MAIKLYYDLMSQPSRALYILFKKGNCKFESKLVDLRAGAHYTDEFSKINRFQKVPVIDHDGFILTESVAIMRYLAQKGKLPENLYPKNGELQTRVDEFLEWQHLGLRAPVAMFFRTVFFNADPNKLPTYKKRMEAALEEFSTKWLGRGKKYILGDQITVADLLAACELEQPRMTGYDPMKEYSIIGEWRDRVQEYFNPYYDEAHVILNKVAKKRQLIQATAKL